MTDEQMESRLRAAGERFRAAATFEDAAPAPFELSRVVAPPATARRTVVRRRGLIASAAAVVAALVLGGTLAVHGLTHNDATPVGTATPLEGTVWQLLGYGSERNPNSSATLYIAPGGQLVADDDCTVMSAEAHATTGRLNPTGIEVRPRSCVDSNAPTFSAAVAILTAGPAFAIHGNELTVSDGHSAMHLTALPGAIPPTDDVPTLTGTRWALVAAYGPSGSAEFGRGESFALDDGRLKASDGCNTLTAAAGTTGGRLDLTTVRSTRLPCPSNAIDPTIDAVLSAGSITALVRGGRLTLSRKGAGRLVYAWIPTDAKATDPAALAGVTWQIAGVAGHPAVGSATLRLGVNGRYTATDGCSRFGGRANVQHGALTLAGVPSRPTCGGSVGAQATTIDSYLSQRPLWSIRGGDLVIDGGSAQLNSLVFTSVSPAPTGRTSGLADTTWQLTGVTTGTRAPSLAPNSGAIRLGFVNKGQVDYDDGVNHWEGPVTIGADTLRIEELTGTAAGCTSSPRCTQTGVIDDVLHGTPSWSMSGNRLTISKVGVGTLVYELTSSPSDSSGPTGPPSSTTDPNPGDPDPDIIYGLTWKLEAISYVSSDGSGRGHSVVSTTTVRFDGNGHLTLVTYCSSQTEPVSFADDQATLSKVTSDHGGCLDSLTAQSAERATIVKVFTPGTVVWSSDGHTLSITRKHVTLTFRSS